MGFFDIFSHWFKRDDISTPTYESTININPATGYPMLNDCIDIAGNPYGTSDDAFMSSSDSFSGISSSNLSLIDD